MWYPKVINFCGINWTPVFNEKLSAKPDSREEAREYDKFAIGIYKEIEDGENELVGHVPLELSSLLYHFLNADTFNFIKVIVIGKRKREIGLVVPAKFDCYTSNKKISTVLDEQLSKRKDKFKTLEVHHKKKKIIANFHTLYDDKIFEKTIYICYMWYVISKSFVFSLFLVPFLLKM